MQLDTDRIRALIASWKVSSDSENFQKIRELLDSYIYFFPKLAYRAPAAICAEFYLFVEPLLPSVLRSYPLDSPYQFASWLNQVLIFKYADFSKQSPCLFAARTVPLEDIPIAYKNENPSDSLSILSPGERALILFCEKPLEMSPKNIADLSDFCGCAISHVLEYYGKICAFHDFRFERLAEEALIADRIQEALARLKQRIQKGSLDKKEALSVKASRLENRLRRIQNQRGKEDKQIQKIAADMIGNTEKTRRILARIRQKAQYAKTRQEPHAPL